MFNTLRECGTLPNAHVSSERAHKQNMEEQENILDMVQRSPTTTTQIALSRKPFGIGHIYVNIRMTDTMTSQNIDLSSWDTLYTRYLIEDSCIKTLFLN